MRPNSRLVVLGCVLALLSVQGRAQQTDALAGIYLCEGKGQTEKYAAVVTISPSGDVWDLAWAFEPHGEAKGVGLLKDGVLAVIYQLDTGEIGLSAYTVHQEGATLRFDGRWTVPGTPGTFPETLTKTTATDPTALKNRRPV